MELRRFFLTMAAVVAIAAVMTGCPTPADNAAGSYGIIFAQAGPRTFPTAQTGYTHVEPIEVRVYNTGDTPTGELRITVSPDDFMPSRAALPSIAVGGYETFSVIPVLGLYVGLHTARVTVYGAAAMEPRYFDVYFRVTEVLRDITLDFTCPNFLRLIRLVLDIPAPQPIYLHDAEYMYGMFISAIYPDFPTSLAGIEHFTNLRYLAVNFGRFSYVDLSNNLQLRHLDLSYNVERMQDLDVSFLVYLEWLDLINSGLRHISFGEQPNLATLLVGGNTEFRNLDLSSLSGLVRLNIYGNQGMDSICLRYNPNLRYLQLVRMGLTGEVNVSRNPELRIMSVSENSLDAVCVRHNPYLEFLDVAMNLGITEVNVSGNRDLHGLSVFATGIKRLDLTSNTGLYNLNASDNRYLHAILWPPRADNNIRYINLIGDFSYGGALTYFAPNAPNLREVRVYLQPLTHIDLSYMPYLESVAFGGRMTDTSPAYMNFQGSDNIRSITMGRFFTGLFFAEDRLYYFDADHFPQSVEDLALIDLNLRQIRNLGRFGRLRYLYVANNYLEELDVRENRDLRTLFVNNNRLETLDVSGLRSLWFLLAQYNYLTRVYVEDSGLGLPDPRGLGEPTVLLAFNNMQGIADIIGYEYLQNLVYGVNLAFFPQRHMAEQTSAPIINTDVDWLTPYGEGWRLPDIRVGEFVQWQFELLYQTFLHNSWFAYLPRQDAGHYSESLYLCVNTGVLSGAPVPGDERDWQFYIIVNNFLGYDMVRFYLRVLPATAATYGGRE